jgi:hypothetical protein
MSVVYFLMGGCGSSLVVTLDGCGNWVQFGVAAAARKIENPRMGQTFSFYCIKFGEQSVCR